MVGDGDPCAALGTCRIAGLDARNLRPHFGSMFYRPASRTRRVPAYSTPWCCRARSAGSRRLNRAGQANLAPFSFFNAVAYTPPQVMFAATGPHDHGGLKDSVANIEATGEFVVNFATWELREAVNASSIGAPARLR